MNLTDVRTKKDYVFLDVPCRCGKEEQFDGDSGHLQSTVGEELLFLGAERSFSFRVIEEDALRAMHRLLNEGCSALAEVGKTRVLESGAGNVFHLTAVFFLREERLDKIQVLLSEAARRTLEKENLLRAGAQMKELSLASEFVFTDALTNTPCFAFSRGDYHIEGMRDVAKAEGEEEEPSENRHDVMQIVGRTCTLFVRLEGEEDDVRAVAYRCVKKRVAPYVFLGRGSLSFSDVSSYASMRMRELLSETPGYTTAWKEYANREGDFLLARAREVGVIALDASRGMNEHEDGTVDVFVPGDTSIEVRPGEELEECAAPPVYLENKALAWEEYQEEIRKQSKVPAPRFEVVELGGRRIRLKKTAEGRVPSKGGKLYYAITGDSLQIMRRREARERIESGTMPSTHLAFILASATGKTGTQIGSLPGHGKKRRHIEPMSALVQEKVFAHPPTVNQRRAIEIALNTPDIAVIQGPPGTGKTTVITAILERLSELSDKKRPTHGQVLITSLQHDAVNNIRERITINSLPTVKFGRKRGGGAEESMEVEADAWRRTLAARLAERHPEFSETQEQRRVCDAFKTYLVTPHDAAACAFLRTAIGCVHDAGLRRALEELLEQLSPPAEMSHDILPAIRRLRTDAESFADDGAENALTLYSALAGIELARSLRARRAEQLALLRAAASTTAPTAELLAGLSHLRTELMELCTPRPAYREERVREEVAALYARVREALLQPKNAVGNVVYDFFRALSDDPYAVRDAIAAYGFAYAATAQQSEGIDIKKAKGVQKKEHPSYPIVIVDEAARVSPGDLMIPLSQAEERIILVGDQRQLPHIYNEEILRSMSDTEAFEHEDDIKESMFKHLWEKAKELERVDGIPRTITLDEQYRMHPLLGEFVSENFYTPYGEGFCSPRPPEDFGHPFGNAPLRWVDLPASLGKETECGGSRIREREADYIVDTVWNYAQREDARGLDFGVISFYRAQANLIKSALEKRGDLGLRIRVGTVDEFQGMEFDVIFLSVVRTGGTIAQGDLQFFRMDVSRMQGQEKEDYDKKVRKRGAKYYGFLTSDNRLCVALSRQKRLLVAVGDAALFTGADAQDAAARCVPAMRALYLRCEQEGSVVHAQ